jgi:anti-sigma factor RsiW
MNTSAITDELLSAWVDGELDADERARVQAWLRDHPEDRARSQAWKADRAALAAHFQGVLDAPLPAALRQTVMPGTGRTRWALAAAAAGLFVAGALLGGGGVWQWQQERHAAQLAQARAQLAAGTPQGWVQRAAFAHSVYVGEPRHAVEVQAQEEHLARWLTRRIAIPVKLFDLREQGFELVGGRLLPDGPGKSAQLMYQPIGDTGPQRRVTVYLRKPEAGADTAFAYEQKGPLGMFYWVEEGAGYALVGELPKATLLALAQAIHGQHPAAGAQAPAAASAPR